MADGSDAANGTDAADGSYDFSAHFDTFADRDIQSILDIPITPLRREYKELNVLFHLRKPVRFIGFLMALEEGFYAEEGLPPIHFLWYDESIGILQSIRNDSVQFMTNRMARVYRLACMGNPSVPIDQISSRSSFGVLFRKDLFRDINSFEQLHNMKLGSYFRVMEEPRVASVKAHLSKEIVYFCYDGHILLRTGAIDGLYCSEVELPRLMTYTKWRNDFEYLRLSDTDFDLPGQSLNCRLDFLLKFPDLCEKFVRATYRGFYEAANNPERALEVVKKYCEQLNQVYDEVIFTDQLQLCIKLIDLKSRIEENGDFTPKQFERMQSLLIDAQMVSEESAVPYEDFFFPVMKPETKVRLDAIRRREKERENQHLGPPETGSEPAADDS